MTTTAIKAKDLTKEYPSSPNAILGNFILLPRIIDKCRADIAGKAGNYDTGCGLDMRFFNAFNIDYKDFRAEVEAGKNDDELLAWVNSQLGEDVTEDTILAWGYDCRDSRPQNDQYKAFLEGYRRKTAPNVRGIFTFFDMLDAEEGRIS
jgi:hypothetical protein